MSGVDPKNVVTVCIGGRRYAGWKSVRIEAGIEQIARAFALEVTEAFPGSTDFGVFRGGDLVQVYIGDDLVCTGWITATPIKYDGKTINVQIQGKSRTVDLVECCSPSGAQAVPATAKANPWKDVKTASSARSGSVNPTQTPGAKPQTSWSNLPASKIIEALAAPYGINVKNEVGDLGKLPNHSVNPGEKVFETINHLIAKENLVVTDDERGNLVITSPGSSGTSTESLEFGRNILSGSADFNFSDRYSDYIVLGQRAGSDIEAGRSVAEGKGVASDVGVLRYRLLVLKDAGQSTSQSLTARAQFEATYRRGDSRRVAYAVQGWRQSNGQLWLPNLMVRVSDGILGQNEELLINKVTFLLSASGMTTTIEAIPPGSFKREVSSKVGAQTNQKVAADPWKGVR